MYVCVQWMSVHSVVVCCGSISFFWRLVALFLLCNGFDLIDVTKKSRPPIATNNMYVCMNARPGIECLSSCTWKGTTTNTLPAQTDVIRRWARYFFAAVHFPINITFRICRTYFGGTQNARQHFRVITAGSGNFLAAKYRPIDITFRVSGRKTSSSKFDVPPCWFGSIVPQCVSVVPGLF